MKVLKEVGYFSAELEVFLFPHVLVVKEEEVVVVLVERASEPAEEDSSRNFIFTIAFFIAVES